MLLTVVSFYYTMLIIFIVGHENPLLSFTC